MIVTKYWKTLSVGVFLGFAQYAFAAHEEHPDHEHLQKVDGLDFSVLLQHALEQAPQTLEMPVRKQQAEAFTQSSRSWIAGRPTLVFSMNDDTLLDNTGMREQEYGVQLPLWRSGEMKAAQEQAQHYSKQTEAWENWLKWQLSGELRSVLIALETAEKVLMQENQATATAAELHAVTQKLFDSGAVAKLDLLQSENLMLSQQQKLLSAEAGLVDAERYYVILTGLQDRPAVPYRELLSADEEISDSHPLLHYLLTEVSVARSGVTQSENAAKGNPELTIGSRRERGDRFMPYTDSIGISLNIPVGGKSVVAARTSTARRQQADAEVVLMTARRSLQQDLHEAEHELYVTRQALPLAEQQLVLGEQRRTMAQAAYSAGELTLAQVLVAVQEAALAQKELLNLQMQEQLLITRFNQTLGVLP